MAKLNSPFTLMQAGYCHNPQQKGRLTPVNQHTPFRLTLSLAHFSLIHPHYGLNCVSPKGKCWCPDRHNPNVNFSGNRVTGVIKMQSYWSRAVPASSVTGVPKRCLAMRTGYHMKMEAETGLRQLQASEGRPPPWSREGTKRDSTRPRVSEGVRPCWQPWFLARTMRQISVVLSDPVCATLWWPP